MYDAKGRDLAVGDFVLVPAVVTQLFADEDGCFVGLETSFGDSNDNTVTMWPVDSAVVLCSPTPTLTFSFSTLTVPLKTRCANLSGRSARNSGTFA